MGFASQYGYSQTRVETFVVDASQRENAISAVGIWMRNACMITNCNNCMRKLACLQQTGGKKRRDFKSVLTEVNIAEDTGEADFIVHLRQHIPAYLSSVNAELFKDEDDDQEEQIDVAVDTVNRRFSDFEGQGSGWPLNGIDRVAMQCSKHSPITGSSYIPTPKFIESRKAVVNVKNKYDYLCFLYSVLAHIHPVDRSQNPNRVSNYMPFLHELDYSGLTFPLKIHQIRKFEDQNSQISINVLYHDPESHMIMPLRVTEHRNRLHHVNLFLLYSDGAKSVKMLGQIP